MSVEAEAKASGSSRYKRLSGWWVFLSLAVGLAVAILVGQFFSDGDAEIAGVMACSLLACTRIFWDFRVKRWFVPLVIGWACVHIAVLVFLIFPTQVQASKGFISLVWVELFAFVGVIFLASRLWGGLPDPTDGDASLE